MPAVDKPEVNGQQSGPGTRVLGLSEDHPEVAPKQPENAETQPEVEKKTRRSKRNKNSGAKSEEAENVSDRDQSSTTDAKTPTAAKAAATKSPQKPVAARAPLAQPPNVANQKEAWKPRSPVKSGIEPAQRFNNRAGFSPAGSPAQASNGASATVRSPMMVGIHQINNYNNGNPQNRNAFPPYLHPDEVQLRLERGQLIEGNIRINQRNYQDAFVSSPGGIMADILVKFR